MRAEAVEAGDVELVAQALRARSDVEVPSRHTLDRACACGRRVGCAVRRQDLGWPDAFERGAELVGFDFGEPQCAAREVQPREADVDRDATLVVARAHRKQVDVVLVGQQGGIGQRAGRDDAHDLALDRPLRRGRVADLLADRDRFAHLHELRQILFDRVVRDAGHLDRRAGRCAALRERQVEQAGGFLRVFEEQFVEVAHPVEDERVGVIGLDAQVLLHHRGVASKGLGRQRGHRSGVKSLLELPEFTSGPDGHARSSPFGQLRAWAGEVAAQIRTVG
ncbi:hypothetical protein BamMEX5DRAFT_5104 [Burkholderia ambifaria MEX-5]|uniref:Uncharacterized protein n=1 Tax=Burkholderia ambifaria MEX-5 TaxID=396597 RepID=B1TBD8_9BURK|nr:hypothetical protein BamMEX5DRAFT_5104 [Burkholderia ambifaria MEX-5]